MGEVGSADAKAPTVVIIMKTLPHGQATTPRLRFILSGAAAIALALFAASRFAYANVIWNPSYYGEYGLSANSWAGYSVRHVVPGSPADKAGIRAGDRIERPHALHDRLVLTRIVPRPGEQITLSILHGANRRTVTLQARPLPPLSPTDRVLLAVDFAWLFVFVAVSFALVLLRPSIMTWGLFLFPLNLTILFMPSDLFFSYVPTNSFLALRIVEDIISATGIVGFFVFCIRFPANAPTGWRKTVESLGPFLYVVIAAPFAYWDFVNILIRPAAVIPYAFGASAVVIFALGTVAVSKAYLRANDVERRRIAWVILGLLVATAAAVVALTKQFFQVGPQQHWIAHATLMVGTVVLLVTYFEARGLERQRIKWVVLGVACAWIADGANHLGLSMASIYTPKWFIGAVEVLYIALPLSVAYAVIRHRVIDVRFVVSRALALGVVASILALTVIGIGWLFSSRLPNTHLEAAVYAGVAVLVGFSLNIARQTIGKTIDFVFFRPWYRTREQVETIGDAIHRATLKADLFEPLTRGIASAFSLASVALFERVEGAGFVRVAAQGWPRGALWHVLSDDPLAARADQCPRVVDIESLEWHEHDLPGGVARPIVMLPVVAGRRVPAMLLCGAHESGTGLDPDEIRAIRRLGADAGLVYGRSGAVESGVRSDQLVGDKR